MIKLLKYLKWYEWILILILCGVVFAQVWYNITLPECTLKLSQYLMMPNISEYWQDIVWVCVKMLLYALAVVGCAIVANGLSSFISVRLLARVRAKVFEKVNSFSHSEINKFSVSSLITRTGNDISQLQQVYSTTLTMGFNAPLTAILAIIKVVYISKNYNTATLSLVNIISVILIAMVVFVIVFMAVPKFKLVQKSLDNINLVMRENLTGLKVVRASGAEKTQEDKFDSVNTNFAKIDVYIGKIMSIIDPALSLIMSGTSLAIVWIVGSLAGINPTILEIMSTFTQYSLFIIMSFTSLSVLFMFVPRGIVSAKRINEVLDTPLVLKDGIETEGTEKGTIELKNVCFEYNEADEYVIKNINFKVEQGQTVAFIGSTGSGKSTLINLIPRFYDCSKGEVIVNGRNVKEYSQKALHEMIGYVPQRGLLFSGTVKDNITYGKEDATEEEIAQAIEIAQADFVYNFEDGLNHHISQGGKNVSGGQKQRLSIARAIVKKPDILVFDDSFSALDYKTDLQVRENLSKYFAKTTKLIVAQRIGTIMNADKIVVLNEGEIVGIGKHSELLKTCPIYKEIALSQLSEKELEEND